MVRTIRWKEVASGVNVTELAEIENNIREICDLLMITRPRL